MTAIAGERMFSKVQYGLESAAAHGTAVAADTMLVARANVPKDRIPTYLGGPLGVRIKENQAAILQIKADGIRLAPDFGYFQLLPLLLSLGLKGGITPTEVTPSQADWKWTFDPSLTADNAPDSVTLEMGDDNQAFEVEYVMCKSLKISGKTGSNAPVSIEAELLGKQVTPTGFTGGLSLPVTEVMVANLAKFYLDPTWVAIGTTPKTGLLREYNIELQFGIEQLFHGASKLIDSHRQGYIAAAANFVFDGNADADAIYDLYQAQTFKAIRLRIEGGLCGSTSKHTFDIDMGGMFEDVVPMGQESNGQNLHTAVFHPIYDGTGAKAFRAEVITNVAAI